MNEDAVRVDRIEFRAAMPSLRLLDAAPLAFSVQCMLPAVLGLFLILETDALFFGKPESEPIRPALISLAVPWPLLRMMADGHAIVVRGFSAGLTPFARLPLFAVLMGLTGVAVSRAAGMRFCAGYSNGAFRSMRHAAKSLRSVLVSAALVGLLCSVANGVFLLCLKITDFARLAHPLQSLAGVPAWMGAMLLIAVTGVCGAGWLLSLSAMGVDSCKGAESLSRGISYVLSRFRRAVVYTVFLLAMTGCLAEAGWWLLNVAGALVTVLSSNSPGDAGLPSLRFPEFRQFVVEAWKFSTFFCSVTICYVLLRRVEDGVHLNESDGCLPPGQSS